MQSLTVLSLNTNPDLDFNSIVEQLSEIRGLKELDLSNNNLTKLPTALAKMLQLEVLGLYRNTELASDLIYTAATLVQIYSLKKLDFRYNTTTEAQREIIRMALPRVEIEFD